MSSTRSFSVAGNDSWVFGKQGRGNVDYSKILLAWIVTSFFLFFWGGGGLEDDFYLHSERGWVGGTLEPAGVELGLDGGGGASVRLPSQIDSSTFGLSSKGMKKETDGQMRDRRDAPTGWSLWLRSVFATPRLTQLR